MTVPFSWELPYAWPRKPVLARNVVCTSQPLAAQAGLAMLAEGGSAVDAVLAAAITLTLVEPVSNGIGSDAFAIVWDGARLHGLNASGRSPAAWTPEYFRGGPVPVRGWNSVTVPGAVSAWTELHARFGRLPFARVFEPAIGYGRDGFLVSPTVAAQWAGQVPELRSQPGFAEAFLPGGRAPAPGERFRLPEHAATLEMIAATGGEAFYRGELAATMDAHSTANGGAMRAADLAAHGVDWVDPISIDYRGYTLHEIPPNGQGIIALIALGILRHFDMASLPVDSADSVHLQIEAIKLAFADAQAYVADIDHMAVRPDQLLNADYLRERSKLIDPAQATAVSAGRPSKGGTVYLTAADADGMMVSMIQSNYDGFGSGVVVPGTGISLQNRGTELQRDAGAPQCRRAAKAPIPHHRSGFPDPEWRTGDEFRRDGRSHAAAGSSAAGGAHRRLRPEPAGGVRRAAVPLDTRHAGEPRGWLSAGNGRRAAPARPRCGHGRRLQPVRQLPGDLAIAGRVSGGERPAP